MRLIIIHPAARVKPPRTRRVLQMEEADWLFRCTLDIFGTVFTVISGAQSSSSSSRISSSAVHVEIFSDSPAFSSPFLPPVCVWKAVRVWHGQTRTKWIHRGGESGSEEAERGREQTLQHGPGENCTGTYIIILCVTVHGLLPQISNVFFCGHAYQDVSYFLLFASRPIGKQFQILH